jgi:outer membrane protein TolC
LFLFTEYQWAPRWAEYCQLVDKLSDASTAIAVATAELHTALADLDSQLAAGVPGRSGSTTTGS